MKYYNKEKLCPLNPNKSESANKQWAANCKTKKQMNIIGLEGEKKNAQCLRKQTLRD